MTPEQHQALLEKWNEGLAKLTEAFTEAHGFVPVPTGTPRQAYVIATMAYMEVPMPFAVNINWAFAPKDNENGK